MNNMKILLLNHGRLAICLLCIFCIMMQLRSVHAPTMAKAQNKAMFTYLALGDSLTAGIGATETNYLRLSAFVPQLTSYLRQKHPVYVENHGIPGLTSSQLLRYLREGMGMTTKLSEANLITITIGGNDLLQLLNMRKETEISQEELQQVLTSLEQNISEIITYIRQMNKEVPIYILDIYSPYGTGHPLHPLSQEVITSFNHQLNKVVTAEEKIYMVSVHPFFLNRENNLTHISKNDIHPNDQGYKIIFDAFKQNIVQ